MMACIFERMPVALYNPRDTRGVDGFRRVSSLPTRTRTRAGFTRPRHGFPVPVLFPMGDRRLEPSAELVSASAFRPTVV